MWTDIIKIKARLTLYSTDDGGRKTAIKTGYRPNHVFDYKENTKEYLTTYIGQIDFDKDLVYPGETEFVSVQFLKHQNIEELIEVGRRWWIHEGLMISGEAEIIEIIKN